MKSEVATGRRMNGRDGFMNAPPHAPPACALSWAGLGWTGTALRRIGILAACRTRRRAFRVARRHLAALAQLVSTVDDHAVARGQPGQDRNPLAVDRPELDRLYGNRVVRLDQID